jgi:farnesyl-diphosphate farnesyltransferase
MQSPATVADETYQENILQDVSRTFALTIPQLPPALRKVVSNAYLLCRIADTIEDDNGLTSEQTRQFSDMFIEVVAGNIPAETFSEKLYPLLSDHTIQAEHDLIKNAPSVIRITHSFNANQRKALERCITIMAQGMADYQDTESLHGLENLQAMDEYCYYVAGVVGEMLTELFCDYSNEIDQNKTALIQLAVSFGQGLQMTNILKDIWEDRQRGACWLPRDIFRSVGLDLGKLTPENNNMRFASGLGILIGVAKNHLRDALTYTLMIPAHETGIRRFCLWAIGMAVLTLNKLNKHREFSHGNQVKITRRNVKATVLITSLLARYNPALILLFNLFCRNLPKTDIREKLNKLNCTAL